MLRRGLLTMLLGSPLMVFGKGHVGFNSPGLVEANKLIIVGAGGGEFIYNAAGTVLLYSNVGANTTDPLLGNPVTAGTIWYQVGAQDLFWQTGDAAESVLANLSVNILGGGTTRQAQLQLTGTSLGTGSAGITLLSGSVDGTIKPSIGTSGPVIPFVGGVEETWHNLGAPIAGWTVNGRARYRLLADSGLVLVELQNIALPGAPPADNTVIWTSANGLPVGYRPASSTGRNPAYYNGGAGGEHPAWSINTDGSIVVFGVGGTTVARMDLPLLLVPTL